MLEVQKSYRGKLALSNAALQRVYDAVFTTLKKPPRAMVLAIVGDAAIRKLNKQYRSKDKVTDILSFAAAEGMPIAGSDHSYAGEVIISYPQVLRQARVYGNTPAHEFSSLLVHGTLHLLGYDHITDPDYARMHAAEKKILAVLGYETL